MEATCELEKHGEGITSLARAGLFCQFECTGELQRDSKTGKLQVLFTLCFLVTPTYLMRRVRRIWERKQRT